MTSADTRTGAPADERQPGSLAWLWALLAISALLLSILSILALIPVGVVLLVAGVIRRLTATSSPDRALGNVLAVTGVALAGVTAAIGLTLIPTGEGEIVLDRVHDVEVEAEH